MSAMMKRTRKMKKRTLATVAATAAMPPNPRTAATMAMANEIKAHFSIPDLPPRTYCSFSFAALMPPFSSSMLFSNPERSSCHALSADSPI